MKSQIKNKKPLTASRPPVLSILLTALPSVHYRALPAVFFAITFFILVSNPVVAQLADHTKPINVKADSSIYDDRRGTQTLSGNVEITQGSMSIFADSIKMEIRDGTLFRITGTGSPIKFQQLTPNNELIRGECNEIIYNTATTAITFRGNANFERPGQKLTGDTIEYNLNELTFKATGNDKGRVNITLQPGKLKP